jgi:hypothetical protein
MMVTERRCLYCNSPIDLNWARGNRKYCQESCRRSYHYYNKLKKKMADKYQIKKRAWEKSPNGKRAGVSIRQWLRLPKDWQ